METKAHTQMQSLIFAESFHVSPVNLSLWQKASLPHALLSLGIAPKKYLSGVMAFGFEMLLRNPKIARIPHHTTAVFAIG